MVVARIVCDKLILDTLPRETVVTNVIKATVSISEEDDFKVELEVERVNPTTAKIEKKTYPVDLVVFEPCVDEDDPADDDWHVDW